MRSERPAAGSEYTNITSDARPNRVPRIPDQGVQDSLLTSALCCDHGEEAHDGDHDRDEQIPAETAEG